MNEIVLDYAATPADLRPAIRGALRFSRLVSYTLACVTIAAVVAAYVPLTRLNPLFPMLTVGLGVVLLLGVLWRMRAAFEKRIEEQIAGQPALLAPSQLRAGPRGVTLRGPTAESTFAWEMITGVSTMETGVLLQTGGTLFWFVPDSAFADKPARAAFCKQIEAWRTAPPVPLDLEPFDEGPDDRRFQVSLTDADYVALSRFVIDEGTPQRGFRRWGLPIAAMLVAIASWIVQGPAAAGIAFAGAAVLTLLMAIPMMSSWILPWRIRRLRKRYPGRFPAGEQQMLIGPAGIRLRSGLGRFQTPWGSISRVVEDAAHLYLFLGTQSAYIVPKRVLVPGEARELLARWGGWNDLAPRLVGLPVGPRGKSPESDNPFEPPGAI